MSTGELRPDVPPAAMLVVQAIERVKARTRRPCASTTAICAELGWRICEGTTRHYLRLLEQAHFVYRTSERSGWYIWPAESTIVPRWTLPTKKPAQWWDRRWWMRTRQLTLPIMVEVVLTDKPRPARLPRTIDRSWIQLPLNLAA